MHHVFKHSFSSTLRSRALLPIFTTPEWTFLPLWPAVPSFAVKTDSRRGGITEQELYRLPDALLKWMGFPFVCGGIDGLSLWLMWYYAHFWTNPFLTSPAAYSRDLWTPQQHEHIQGSLKEPRALESSSPTKHLLDQCSTTICTQPAGNRHSPECHPYCGHHHGISGVYNRDSQDHNASQETQRHSNCCSVSVWHNALDSIYTGQTLPAGPYSPWPSSSAAAAQGETSQMSSIWHWTVTWISGNQGWVCAHCSGQSRCMTDSAAGLTNVSSPQETGQSSKV